MESTSARDVDRRLAELVRSERHLVVQFVIELSGFAKRELYRELGYTSLFYYCVRQLGLSKSSAFRRSEVARLIARFPVIAERLAPGRLSIRALVELREVLTEENHVEVLARAEGKSEEEAQLLAVEYRPKPVPRDVVRTLPVPPAPLAFAVVPAGTKSPPPPPEVVKPLTPELRRLSVTVSADFIAELEQVRAALSHKYPDGDFEQVVREAFKLVLERDRKRKALTDRAARAIGNLWRKRSLRPCRGQARSLGTRPRALYVADGRRRGVRFDAPSRVRPRSRGGSRRQANDRQHAAALQEP
jgi:hypothetical protein